MTNSTALKFKIKGYFGNSDLLIGGNSKDPIFITSFDLSPATPTITDLNIPQSNEITFISNYQRERNVSIEGTIVAPDYDTLEFYCQKLQRAFYPATNQVVEFTFTSLAGNDYSFNGTLASLTMPDSPDNGQFAKRFQAQIKFTGKPYLKGTVLISGFKAIATLGLQIPVLGLQIPTLGIEITDGNSANIVLENKGNVATFPIWYFTGQGTNWKVVNQTSDNGAFILGTSANSFDIPSGQTVVVDSDKNTVLQNGTNRDGFNVQNFSGLALVAGSNTVTIQVGSNNDTNTQVSVEYYYFYQGV